MLIQCIDYKDRLLQPNMLPLTMRLEYEDIVFVWKCLHGMYDINVHDFVKFSYDINHVTHSSNDSGNLSHFVAQIVFNVVYLIGLFKFRTLFHRVSIAYLFIHVTLLYLN